MKEKLQSLRLKLGEEITRSEQKNILGGLMGYRCSTMVPGQCTSTPLSQGYCQAVWHGNLESCNLPDTLD
jgi:hypothetical protein